MSRKRAVVLLARISSYVLAVALGIGIIKWHIPPYGFYVRAKQLAGIPRYLGPEAELLERFAFVDPLVEPDRQVDPPVRTAAELSERVRRLAFPVEALESAYERAGAFREESAPEGMVSLSLELAGPRRTHCYLVRGGESSSVRTAVLVIPGSGLNQSYEIVKGSEPNYHDGLLEAARKHGDVYVYVKPNEAVRAIHDGRRKLSYDFVINTLIGHGGSYSALYVAETVAWTKYLQGKYDRVVVAGVSQGGTAALLNGLQSRPDAVIAVSPGFLPQSDYAVHASPYNIMIPGLFERLTPDRVRDRIRSNRTLWLFTLGKGDQGVARIAYEERTLERMFEGIDRVAVARHAGGHEVPQALVDSFLGSLPVAEK